MSVLLGLSIVYQPYYDKLIDQDLFNPSGDFALTQHVQNEIKLFEETGNYKRPPRERFPNLFTNLGDLSATPNPIVRLFVLSRAEDAGCPHPSFYFECSVHF